MASSDSRMIRGLRRSREGLHLADRMIREVGVLQKEAEETEDGWYPRFHIFQVSRRPIQADSFCVCARKGLERLTCAFSAIMDSSSAARHMYRRNRFHQRRPLEITMCDRDVPPRGNKTCLFCGICTILSPEKCESDVNRCEDRHHLSNAKRGGSRIIDDR